MGIPNNKLQYYVLDVFANERYKGNPLSVVSVDKDLELPVYQKIAREFGYSETSFVYYSSEEKAFKVRSFTPAGIEVNGAGHNLLGAVCLALEKKWDIFRRQKNEQFVIMKDKTIQLSTRYDNNNLPFVSMLQKSPIIVNTVPIDEIAPSITLHPDDIRLKDWSPAIIKTEVAHLMVPVKDLDCLNKATLNKILLSKAAKKLGFQGCYCFTLTEQDATYIVQSRFFNPGIGIDEDAATGSAAGPLAFFLYHKKYINLNEDCYILQGVKMGQPSTIQIRVSDEGIWVSGSSVIVMEGTLYL